MNEYRVYLLGGDNKIAGASWITAKNVVAAIAAVREQFSCPCEIWQGAERLAAMSGEGLETLY